MHRIGFMSSCAVSCLGLMTTCFAAEPANDGNGAAPAAATHLASAPIPASKCVNDIRVFSADMRRDGNWLGGSDYGYGYPMDGYGYGYDYPMAYSAGPPRDYLDARPGYQIRSLMNAANILAQNGQQQACEDVLATTHTIYDRYATSLHGRDGMFGDGSGWRQRQIAGALPVTDTTVALRSDQLIDTDVRNAAGDALGSVHDLVIDPKTGKIAYLILARGGLFGFDETFVPVPWADFKVTPNASLLVLDTTKATVNAAPLVSDAQFRADGQFTAESHKVDAYWTASLPLKAAAN